MPGLHEKIRDVVRTLVHEVRFPSGLHPDPEREAVDAIIVLLSATQTPEPGVPGSEVLCEECAKVFCPHGERLHFHHDGCPACSEDNERAFTAGMADVQREAEAVSREAK